VHYFVLDHSAEVLAAKKMSLLVDLILELNRPASDAQRHAVQLFLARALFCLFAEKIQLFSVDQFTNAIRSHSSPQGDGLARCLQGVFGALHKKDRSGSPTWAKEFPSVGGELFESARPMPQLNAEVREAILSCATLPWATIESDIFGAIIQAVVDQRQRGDWGMHYTSVENILKLIEPLFLADLQSEFQNAIGDPPKLLALMRRLRRIRIFDPACGSGNFLVIAYKQLRQLEQQILTELGKLSAALPTESMVRLSQFYGVELDPFACQIAKVSLRVAEQQMHMQATAIGVQLDESTASDQCRIDQANATQVDWRTVCPVEAGAEYYLLGNPPYSGARRQTKEQKRDMATVFAGHPHYKDADYACCWFLKSAEYLSHVKGAFAFVATNSICQGEQVAYLWSRVLEKAEIAFAYPSFKWANLAKDNAGVSCVIVGVRKRSDLPKVIYTNQQSLRVKNISPYLSDAGDTVVQMAADPIANAPKMVMGNMARDGGNLILSEQEAEELRQRWPHAALYLRPLFGANEFLHSKRRWCLWLEDADLPIAAEIPEIRRRIDATYAFRVASKAHTTNQYSSIPHKFAQRSYSPGTVILVPRTTSQRREYIPFGFLPEGGIVTDSAQAIYTDDLSLFALITSRMHNVWVHTVAGRFGVGIRYSKSLCYNPFPFPTLSAEQRQSLGQHASAVIGARAAYPEKTMAQLYDPRAMPSELRTAHQQLDEAVERCYQPQPFASDAQRVAYLLAQYERSMA